MNGLPPLLPSVAEGVIPIFRLFPPRPASGLLRIIASFLMRVRSSLLLLLCVIPAVFGAPADDLVTQALAAEARMDTGAALRLFLQANEARPNDAFILQKIGKQYSDSAEDAPDDAAKKSRVEQALAYSKRAVELDPRNAVNVLSLAICYGKLGLYSDTRTKIENSRLVKDYTEQALALNPDYDWAYHVLGRWHYEVARLGATQRFFVRLIYGGLPPASSGEAVRLLRKAVELRPDCVSHHIELGLACIADGQVVLARDQLQTGLALPSRDKQDEAAKRRGRAALASLK